MSAIQDWRSVAAVWVQEVAAATATAQDSAVAAGERNKAIAERVAALRAENARRTVAGVRVNLNSDSFDARHIKMLHDAIDCRDANANELARTSLATTSILGRAVRLISQMADALDEAEAAVAARAARDAVEAEAKAGAAMSSYLRGTRGRA